MSSLVFTDVAIPDVDEIYFSLLFANRINTFIFYSFLWSATVYEIHSLLSLLSSSGVYSGRYFKICSETPFQMTSPP